jgi:hypothetical protein
VNYFALAVKTAHDTFTYFPATDPSGLQLESLSIAPDALRHHFIAQARILDLQPSQMVAAITLVQHEIRALYPHMYMTGWRGASDGIRLYFSAWTANGGVR